MFTHKRNVLQRISNKLKTLFPEDIIDIIAFGSQVRGDHSDHSDFDVLIIIRNSRRELQEAVIDAFVEEELSSGISMDPLIKTLDSYLQEKSLHTPFYENIDREGISI